MKIIKNTKITKREDVNIIPFLEFYYINSPDGISFSAISESSIKQPDYIIDSTNTLIEIKEIHDKISNQKLAQWGIITNRLQQAVDNNKLLSKVKGTYLVNTPEKYRLFKFDEASKVVLEAVIKDEKNINVFGFNFKIEKVSDQENIVAFGNTGSATSIDPSNIVYQNIKDKLITANKQLGNPPEGIVPSKGIILLVNKYYFPLWNWDLFKAISFTYQDLLNCQNIDEVWYQIEGSNSNFTHKLLFKKTFFKQYESSKFNNIEPDDRELFANWFFTLADMGNVEKNKLFITLKELLKKEKPHKIFPDPQTRQEMVRIGLWLAENKQFDDLIWLINKFIDDPDPKNPNEFLDNENPNYHKQIINNEDLNVITTVLGHLAWTIQKIALERNYIIEAFKYTKKLLKHKNYYVKLEAIIPLTEIAIRRQWLEEYDQKNKTNYYGEFKAITFDLLKKYAKYKSFSNSLTRLFYYFKDLNVEEAIVVLNSLKQSRDAAALFIYFGIFRERHYIEKNKFNSEPLRDILKSRILDTREENKDLISNIVWNFWNILKDNPNEFDTIKLYLDLIITLPYDRKYYSHVERIIEELIDKKPEECVQWFDKSLDKIIEYINNNETTARSIWINSEKIIRFIAKFKSKKIIDLVEKLVDIWKLGAFIGNPKEIFETYNLISDISLKESVVEKFKVCHAEMKLLNLKLEDVNWDLI